MSGPNVEDYTPGWTPIAGDHDGGRWRMTDEIGTMHLLLQATRPATSQAGADTRFYELHGLTLHIYSGPADVSRNAVWPLGDPTKYDPAVHNYSHVATHDVSASALTRYTDEHDVWMWLKRYASNDGAAR